MRNYQGSIECAGCGISGKVKPRRYCNQVCYECQEHIRLGKSVKIEANVFSKFYFVDNGDLYSLSNDFQIEGAKELIEFHRAEAPPYLSESDYPDGNSKQISKAFYELIKVLDVGEKSDYQLRITMDKTYHNKSFFIPTPVAVTLFKLYDSFSKFAINCEKKGYTRGHNLLDYLNSMKISNEDFERRINAND